MAGGSMSAHPSVDAAVEVPARRGASWQRAVSSVLLVVTAVVATALAVALYSNVPRSALLEAEGNVGPGTHLQLQTAQGPMQLTVDSQMNAAGYVHAYGFANGQEYAGYVKLSAANPAAQQVLSQAPSYGQQQITQYPTTNPYTEQVYTQQMAYAQPQQLQQAQAAGGAQPMQLHISPDGSVSLNGEQVSAADGRTAAVLRLLSKQAAQGGAAIQRGTSLVQQISKARERLQQLEAEKEGGGAGERGRTRARREQHEHEPRAAMWAAMQTLMKSVDKIEERQERMAKTVKKVNKIMRYSPFH